ncbi:MAG: SH3 domain-containing protein [Steroidobacteraceae bacterium]
MRLLITCVLLLCSGIAISAERDALEVIVVDPYLELRTGPGRGYPIVQVVSRGETVRILKRRTDWFRIADASGHEGWVHRSQIAETLVPAGTRLEIEDPAREDFGAHRREVGVLLGNFGGANLIGAYGAYAFNAHLAGELALSHLLGSFSDGQIAAIGVSHVFRPDWRIQPFASMGTGLIRIEPKSTVAQSPSRTDQLAYVGAGVRAYLARRFILRAEYKSYVVFTDRNENQEVNEWKIGFAFFF